MERQIPLTRDVVLIGGGHAHALVLRKWGMNPLPGARLTVIDPNPTAPYSGMLPGHIAGHYSRADLELDLVKLARFAGARLILAPATGIDPDARRVQVAGRGDVAFDLASIDIGITSDLAQLEGFADHGLAAKPLGALSQRWASYLGACARGSQTAAVAIIGAGVAGVELALAMMHALRARNVTTAEITLIEAGTPLGNLGEKTRAALLGRLKRAGIGLRTGVSVSKVGADHLRLSDGRILPATLTIGAAGAHPYRWLENTGLALEAGFVAVDETLRSLSHPAIYAVGDCAHLSHAPRPKAGVFAVREAPVLHDNLRADLTGRPRRRFQPQADYLKLISLGEKQALADKSGLRSQGAWLWRLKNHIDRKFMRKFHELPKMPPPPLPKELAQGVREMLTTQPPPCGGCGAKIAAGPLRDALSVLPQIHRDDVLSGPGDDAAILRIGATTQVLTTDHLRSFTADPWLMAGIAAVHALGDVWAMGARPQAVLANITLPQMTPKLQRATLGEIMAAAGDVVAAAGAGIVGGHTTLGAELTIGFTVTGLCANQGRGPITLAGAAPGDMLVLSKPIGSGVLMAAEMQMLAEGRWVAAALQEMRRPNGEAAEILADAHAMTDVTGFGLAGHLMAMIEASNVAAVLQLAAIPLLDGAAALAGRGVRSALYAGNRAIASTMALPEDPPGDARADLLFDPQTAGGLLAAVAESEAADLCARLQARGYRAALVGRIVAGPPMIRVS